MAQKMLSYLKNKIFVFYLFLHTLLKKSKLVNFDKIMLPFYNSSVTFLKIHFVSAFFIFFAFIFIVILFCAF